MLHAFHDPHGTGLECGRSGRVAVLTSTFPRHEGDSVAPFVRHLTQDLAGLGWEAEVLAPHGPGVPTRSVISGIPVRRFRYAPERLETLAYNGGGLISLRKNPARLALAPGFVLAEAATLARLLFEARKVGRPFDLIHAHWALPQGYAAALVSGWLGIPVLLTVHGGDVFGLKAPIFRRFKRRAFNAAQIVTVNSRATREAAIAAGARAETIEIVPMGIANLEPISKEHRRATRERSKGRPLLAFAGRLVPEKGADDLIAASARLRTAHPDIEIVICGDGPERARLEEFAKNLGLADRVCFTGWLPQKELRQIVAAADLFVGPSKQAKDGWVEAQGLVFLEAMRDETMVVATDNGGIPDVLGNGRFGYLAQPNDPSDLAEKINEALRLDQHSRAALIAAARDHALGTYGRDRIAKKFAGLYASLASTSSQFG